MKKAIRVALAGNPNSGKTTVFNNLTGGRQRVGNYPGVTVEKKSGRRRHDGFDLEIVDLPGTYGLTPWSLDEKVARDYLIDERPDVLVHVIDASNIERNLYLTTQFMELRIPMILAFNMSDVAKARGLAFDLDLLAARLGAPIVTMVGHKNKGTTELLDAIVSVGEVRESAQSYGLQFGHDVEDELNRLEPSVAADAGLQEAYASLAGSDLRDRWLAIKLLEGDRDVLARVSAESLRKAVTTSTEALVKLFGDAPAVVIADRRYGFISGACQEAVRSTVEIRHTLSDRADSVMTHRVLGLPIFLVLMYLVFNLTFALGDPLMRALEWFFGWLGGWITAHWPAQGWAPLRSLLVDGVIGGVGGVIVFLPNIMLLFMAIAVLEYSGYMARAAFVVDRLMHRIGLHGKSFIPMLIGFGCTVPAIMATRTLDSRRDRLITMLILPLMSCGARLTIYALLIPAFFPRHLYTPMLWLMYMIGIALAVAAAQVLGKFVFREQSAGLVMELPPYRMPTVKCIFIHMWERAALYLRKAGTIILGVSVVMWILTSYPQPRDVPPDLPAHELQALRIAHSAAGRLGRFLEPALRPMGFDWKVGTALIGAVAAKEVFVSQLAIVHALGEDTATLRVVLRQEYTPLVAFCMMLFCLIGFPCAATVAVTRAESGAWRWAWLQLVGLTALAYVLTTAVYQVGRLFGG